MQIYILIIHVFVGLIVAGVSVIGLIWARKNNAKKYLSFLSAGLAFEVVSGVYMAFISTDITALSLCQNIFAYSAVVAGSMAVIYLKLDSRSLKGYLYNLTPAFATYSLLAVAIIAKV